MPEILFHEHRGKVYPLQEGIEVLLEGVWYTRWRSTAPGSSYSVLVRKRDQRVKVRDGDIESAYGLTLGDEVRDKKTGRRATIVAFGKIYRWATVDGRRRQFVANDEWTIKYRWLEPAKPGGRIMDTRYGLNHTDFFRRFEK